MRQEHMLDTDLVRAFIVVAQNLSFTRAAEQLGTTQPLLSRSMRRLEDVVGEELFDRRKRQIALTPSGAAFLEEAQGVLDQLGLAFRRAQMAGHGSPQTLRVGFMASMWMQTFHRGIRKFRGLHPELALDLRMMRADEQANALRCGDIDLGLMNFNNCDRSDLTWRLVGRERYILAIPSDWPHVPGQAIDLASLRDRPFVLADPAIAPEIHAAHIACCDNAGFQPQVVRYNRDGSELRFLIAAGFGAGFAFESALLTQLDGIHFAPMKPSPETLFADSHVVWAPRRTPPSARDFIECMTSETYAASVIPQEDGFGIAWRRAVFEGSPA
jgi:DNA-binding transcriptional LysR family regulator